jgi:hypothetical protein
MASTGNISFHILGYTRLHIGVLRSVYFCVFSTQGCSFFSIVLISASSSICPLLITLA